jgi:TonB family protein
MPARDSRSPDEATPVPEPAVDAGRSGGLSLGDGTAAEIPGIPSDFHFTYYIERMLALIESRWYKPAAPAGTRARVRFTILRDGRLEGIVLEASSGQPSFDRAALRALYAANPLPPLPPAYRPSSLTVHLSFAE